jgi:hypothetical protein
VRPSVAILSGTPVRLAELQFPARRVQIARTRLAFIHLDNLVHFAKNDRDGRVDGYIAVYLPDELLLLFLRNGEMATAVSFTASGRAVVPLAAVLPRMREREPMARGELLFCEAPLEQLAWMYQSGAAPAQPHAAAGPGPLPQALAALRDAHYTGVVEVIVHGHVCYVRLENGEPRAVYGADASGGSAAPADAVAQLAAGAASGVATVHVFPAIDDLPVQAAPALIDTYREVFWHIVEVAEREVPGDAERRALGLRDTLAPIHESLTMLGTARGKPAAPVVTTAAAMTSALADWALQLLDQLEIIAPGVAPGVLRDATREQRYVLQRAGFYERFPWRVTW